MKRRKTYDAAFGYTLEEVAHDPCFAVNFEGLGLRGGRVITRVSRESYLWRQRVRLWSEEFDSGCIELDNLETKKLEV